MSADPKSKRYADADPLEALLAVSDRALCILDEQQRVVAVNPPFARLLGASPAQLQGVAFNALLEAGAGAASPDFATSASLTDPEANTVRLRRGEGNPITLSLAALQSFEWNGKRLVMTAFVEERRGFQVHAASEVVPLERRQIERELKQAGEWLRQIIAISHDAFVMMNHEGKIEEWNPKAEQMFGWRRTEILGERLSDVLLPPQHRAAHEQGLRRFLETGEGPVLRRTLEVEALCRDGSQMPVELTVLPLKTQSGYLFTSFLRDISERRRAQQELQTRAARMRLQRDSLLGLVQSDEADFEVALARIIAADAQALDVERVSYWDLDAQQQSITCRLLYERGSQNFSASARGLTLRARDYPNYFSAIMSHQPVVANDAARDLATSQFAHSYLEPNGIGSMLDVAVWFRGKVVGVVCHEHVGGPRMWSAEDVDFAASITAMVSLALEAAQRHELSQALRASEEKYRTVLDNVNEAIIVTQDGIIKYSNPKTNVLSGYAPGERAGLPFIDVVHPEDRALVMTNYQRRLRQEHVQEGYVFRIVRKDEQIRWLQSNAVLIEWEGRPASLSFLTDITERKRLEDTLAQSLAERETILEGAVAGIVHIQLGRIRWVNSILETQMLGFAKGELIGQHSHVTFPSHEAWKNFLAAAVPVVQRGETYTNELMMRRKDGRLIPCLFSGRAIDSRDLDKGSIWVLMDITERRQLQDSLKRALLEREAVLETTSVGLALLQNRRMIWVNAAFEQHMGYDKGELLGQLTSVLYHSQEEYESLGAEAYPLLSEGKTYYADKRFKRKDGSVFWSHVSGRAIDPSDASKGSIWVLEDVSEYKRAEEEVRRALERERELSELKSRFVSMTSHEFRTPLATILSSTQLLEDYSERLPAEQRGELIGFIKQCVQRMTEMLDEVLLIGRADSDGLEFNPQRLDLRSYCAQLVEGMRLGLGAQHVIAFKATGGAAEVKLDEKLLRQILSNLLSNAIKYSPAGTRVSLNLHQGKVFARFEVQDEGIGIPPEDQARLFDTFHRGQNVGNISGTGLGLAIVKRAVERHGGTIDFFSEVGAGTTFTVVLPLG